MEKKKIWLLNHHASTPGFGGSTRHYDFAVELSNRGYDTTLIASSFSHDKRSYLFEDESRCV